MSTTTKILSKHGVDPSILLKLYRYDLLDVLINVPGIGCQRLDQLQQQLKDEHGDTRLPSHMTWIYQLALDVLKIPTDINTFCLPHDGLPADVNTLVKLDSARTSAVNDWLSRALPMREQSVILWLYRDHKTPHEVAHNLGVNYQSINSIKTSALRKLRAPRNAQSLRKLICIELTASADTDDNDRE